MVRVLVKLVVAAMFIAAVGRVMAQEILKSSKRPEKFIITHGKDYPLCRDYVALMNRVPRNSENTCGLEYDFDSEAKSRGFKEIDWVEVDPKDHEKMLHMYWVYIKSMGTESIEGWQEKNKERIEEEYKVNFITMKHWLWHAELDLNNDGKKEEVFKLVSRDCSINNASFFMPSEKGFSSKNPGKGIDLHGSIFIYKGRTLAADSFMITEPMAVPAAIGDKENDLNFVYSGSPVCYFESVDKVRGE